MVLLAPLVTVKRNADGGGGVHRWPHHLVSLFSLLGFWTESKWGRWKCSLFKVVSCAPLRNSAMEVHSSPSSSWESSNNISNFLSSLASMYLSWLQCGQVALSGMVLGICGWLKNSHNIETGRRDNRIWDRVRTMQSIGRHRYSFTFGGSLQFST